MPDTRAAGDIIVEVRGVNYAIGGRTIFDDLNLEVRRGEITAVMGPSGTGKTTLLRLLMGAIAPAQGQVAVFGQDISALDRRGLYAPVSYTHLTLPTNREV